MTSQSAALTARVRGAVERWLYNRWQECIHCRECKGTVTPWDAHCPTCGQQDPARLSVSAVVYLLLAFVLLAAVLSIVVWIF